MKKIIVILALCFLALAFLPVQVHAYPTPIRGIAINWNFYETITKTQSEILAIWTAQIPWMQSQGFNSVRLAIAPNTTDANSAYGVTYPFTDLAAVVNLLGANGFTSVLDCHNWAGNMNGALYGSTAWHDFWLNISSVFKNNAYVIAYELMNEPTPSGADVDPSIVDYDDLQAAYATMITDIRATGDNKAIILPDPAYWQATDAGDPNDWATNGQTLGHITNAIESTHNYGYYFTGMVNGLTYGQTVSYYETKLDSWNDHVLSISGEWGFNDAAPLQEQVIWARQWLTYLLDNNYGFYYWMSGYPSEFDRAKNLWISSLSSIMTGGVDPPSVYNPDPTIAPATPRPAESYQSYTSWGASTTLAVIGVVGGLMLFIFRWGTHSIHE